MSTEGGRPGTLARAMRWRPWRTLRVAGFYGAILLGWQIAATLELWPSYVFPSPLDVGTALERLWERGQLQEGIQTTLRRMAIGYGLSIVFGMTLGIAMGKLRWVDETVGSLVLGLQSLPSVTWFPIALLWFGLNEKAIIFVVLMGSVNSIAISARTGIHTISPLLNRASRMFGGQWWKVLLLVTVPAMMPAMIQGLKLGWSFAWRSLLAAELLFVSASLGYLLQTGRDLNNVSMVVGIMLVVIAIGLVFDRLVFGRVERIVSERWGLGERP